MDLRQTAALSDSFHKMTFLKELERVAWVVERRLDELLGQGRAPIGGATELAQAMRYAVLGGGKRIRPFLLMESARLFVVSEGEALDAACALECVHCYSLVHDDLPAMDDDAVRRGRPTLHIAFGEATAILAGDALLTLAFEILGDPRLHQDPAIRAELAAVRVPTLIVLATLQLGAAILAEATLGFLGFGIPDPVPSWGRMLSESAAEYVRTAPWLVIFPGLAISLAVFGTNLFGDALRDILDPRLRD